METFALGLRITGIGMALVFLTLILIMIIIWALDRIFRPSMAAEPGAQAVAPVAGASAISASSAEAAVEQVEQAEETRRDLADEAAAIAVAIVLQQEATGRVKRTADAMPSRTRPPMPWERVGDDLGEDILKGEIITVVNIDPGSGNWKSQGRLKAME